MDFNMYVPTKILFGAGTLNELGKQQLPGKKAVIIISNGKSTRANGYLSRTEEQLAQAGVATSVFDKIQPNPLKETVMEGAAFVKAQGADFIVALGGGSVIDKAGLDSLANLDLLPLADVPFPASYGLASLDACFIKAFSATTRGFEDQNDRAAQLKTAHLFPSS